MNLTPDEMKNLKLAVKSSEGKIKSSAIFLSLYTENYGRDPVCLLQLALAILHDKPIYLLVPEGMEVSENMRRLARHLEFFAPDKLEEATERLISAYRKEGAI